MLLPPVGASAMCAPRLLQAIAADQARTWPTEPMVGNPEEIPYVGAYGRIPRP